MIIKGKSRAGPSQLARHLGRADTNERVEILQLDSAGTPAEAFRDWQTYTLATKGSLGLYHANIDPDVKYEMTPQQWMRAVEILEEELGLQGQPRAVVLHEKNGRAHIHVVWARADMETLTLRSDSQNYQAHERASLRMEQEFGHEHVLGKHAKRDRAKQPDFPRSEVSHDEWQQTERGGMDHLQRKRQVTALYQAAEGGAAFKAALEEACYVVARGDRRGYVLLDEGGKAHSLSRQIDGVKAAELRTFMQEISLDDLPSVAEVRAALLEASQAVRTEPPPEPSASGSTAAQKPEAEADRQRMETLRAAVIARHAVDLEEQEVRHAHEIETLQENQRAVADKAIEDFAKEQARRAVAKRPQEPSGFERLWRAVREAVDEEARTQRLADEARFVRDAQSRRNDGIRIMVSGLNAAQRQEIDALVGRQSKERADLLALQARDLKRRTDDEQRAIARERERERRQQEAAEREAARKSRARDGPDRDGRAR